MACPDTVKLGNTLTFSINTRNPTTSAIQDTDSLPAFSVYEAITEPAILTGTMAKLDDDGTNGFYVGQIAATTALGFEADKSYTVFISATVEGVTSNVSYSFTVAELSIPSPIVVTGPAMTRLQIITQVRGNTGIATGKEDLLDNLCDEALKTACIRHSFNDAITEVDVPVADADEYVPLPSGNFTIVSIRIFETATGLAWPLRVKDRQWWDRNVINPSHDTADAPSYGLMFAGNLYLWPISNGTYTAKFRIMSVPVFASDTQTCPISVLDVYVIRYVTAFLFKAIEDDTNFASWYVLAKEALEDAIVADNRKPAQSTDLGQLRADGSAARPDFGGSIRTDGDLGDLQWM